jgi:hypothetical protein
MHSLQENAGHNSIVLGNAVGKATEHRQNCEEPANRADLTVTAAGGLHTHAGCFHKQFPQHSTISSQSCIKINSYLLLFVSRS